tara:strand:+ start:329 stop:637 length:309 start_codon:yes stop_codon:yes gene_type:complete
MRELKSLFFICLGVFRHQTRKKLVERIKRLFRPLGIIGLLLVFSGSPHAQAQQPSEYQVKAAFLYNFANFVEWPEEALSDTTTLVIGVLEKDPFEAALTRFE